MNAYEIYMESRAENRQQREQIKQLQAELDTLKDVLSWYADDENWEEQSCDDERPDGSIIGTQASRAEYDEGEKARQALKGGPKMKGSKEDG